MIAKGMVQTERSGGGMGSELGLFDQGRDPADKGEDQDGVGEVRERRAERCDG